MYTGRSIGAAENLLIEVAHTLQLICNNPLRWRNEYKHYRELSLRKYPYVIIYFPDEDKQLIIVTAIFHTRNDPEKKYRSL